MAGGGAVSDGACCIVSGSRASGVETRCVSHGFPIRRVAVAFPVVWLWVILAYFGVGGLSGIDNPWAWAFLGIASLIYLLLFGVPVYVLLYCLEITTVNGYLLGALLAGAPIVAVFLMSGVFALAGHAAFVATIGGIIGYWIVERPSKRSR